MRVLMIIDGLPGGGAEKVVLTLAKGLTDKGHHVSLFSLRRVCEYPIPEAVDYQVVEDNGSTPWRKLTELRRRARLLDKAVIDAERRDGPFDIVFSHLHKTDRIVSASRVLNPSHTWFCLHGVFSTSYLGHRKGFSRWLKRLKIQRIYQHRNIVAVSPYVLDDMKQSFQVSPAREAVIPNPFEIDEIIRLSQQPCEMAGKDYLIHVGRFHEAKRHDRLIRAYAKSGLSAPLVLLGQGKEAVTQRLKQLAHDEGVADRVIFQGFSDNPYPWIRHARLLVVSSDSEGFGNVLVEALICNTPVVSTRCPGGPASILTGDLARGLSALDDDSLADKMREIWHSPPVITPDYFERYHIDNVCHHYLSLINKSR